MITLHNITNCLAVFLSFAEQHASMRATSSFTYVQDASTHLVKMAQSDLSKAFSDIDKLSDTWDLVSWDKNLNVFRKLHAGFSRTHSIANIDTRGFTA